MTLKDAMKQRHTVRKYRDIPINENHQNCLNTKIAEVNDKSGLSLKLIIDRDDPLSVFVKMLMAKNVKNYILLSGKKIQSTAIDLRILPSSSSRICNSRDLWSKNPKVAGIPPRGKPADPGLKRIRNSSPGHSRRTSIGMWE